MATSPTPKDRFTALDTLAVCRELRALERSHVDKAFDRPEGGWSLAFRVAGVGRRELLLVPGRFAALATRVGTHPETLSPMARELRRLLTGAGLRDVAEPGGERYLEVAFGRADAPEGLTLALEMFGAGNLVVARGGKIAAVAETRRWAHRTVRVGAEYARPPSRLDPLRLTASEAASILEGSRTDLASTLAARLALGGPVAEEVVARAGWATESPASADGTSRGARTVALLAELVGQIGSAPRGYLYAHAGVAFDVTPYPSTRASTVAEVETREFGTFSEAAEEYFRTVVTAPPDPGAQSAARAKAELERLTARQMAAVRDLEAATSARKADAEAILAHYAEAEAALAAPEGSGESVAVVLGGRPVELWVDRSPRESAQLLFEEAKRIGAKLDGARAALRESEAKTAEELAARTHRDTQVPTPPRRTFWFEKYRWFLTSDGCVVLAGRDAPSNDLVVRRNLKAGDVYVHADLHGAASVIVKRPSGAAEISSAAVEEAGQWAASFSKAWRAGLASATVFWVHPDQVSKSAASGEFVPRGAWVVHGTKNFLRDVPLELALGSVHHEGEDRWSVAPERAVRARGEVRFLLTPGEERDRAEAERALSADLGVSRSLLQSLLPAGGLQYRRA